LSATFRCSASSTARHESQVGTASTVRSFLLVEDPGPWGVDAVHDSRMLSSVKNELLTEASRAGVRVLLIRRHGRSSPDGLQVFAGFADANRPWLESTVLDGPPSLLGLDLAGLGAGRSPGLTPWEEPLFLVCTHGKHDTCCAERGRPVAAALTDRLPEHTWEVSHIGGDRFAGNLLVLPEGLYYGRVDAARAVFVAEAHQRRQLVLDHLRGRCAYPFPVQAAEIYLRRQLGLTGAGALALTSRTRTGPSTRAVFTDGERSWQVVVESTQAAPEQLTCRALRPDAPAEHTLVTITPVHLQSDPV
jgi:hypothetical protein